MESVGQYLSAGYSPDTRGPEGLAIVLAMKLEKVDMFDLLMKSGANVNLTSRGSSTLASAFRSQRYGPNEKERLFHFVEHLVNAGARFNPSELKEAGLLLNKSLQLPDVPMANLLRKAGAVELPASEK